jgi:hypothetical protein
MQTIVTGIKKMLTTTDELAEWQLAMATAISPCSAGGCRCVHAAAVRARSC